jgi:hypothetical protein
VLEAWVCSARAPGTFPSTLAERISENYNVSDPHLQYGRPEFMQTSMDFIVDAFKGKTVKSRLNDGRLRRGASGCSVSILRSSTEGAHATRDRSVITEES